MKENAKCHKKVILRPDFLTNRGAVFYNIKNYFSSFEIISFAFLPESIGIRQVLFVIAGYDYLPLHLTVIAGLTRNLKFKRYKRDCGSSPQ